MIMSTALIYILAQTYTSIQSCIHRTASIVPDQVPNDSRWLSSLEVSCGVERVNKRGIYLGCIYSTGIIYAAGEGTKGALQYSLGGTLCTPYVRRDLHKSPLY